MNLMGKDGSVFNTVQHTIIIVYKNIQCQMFHVIKINNVSFPFLRLNSFRKIPCHTGQQPDNRCTFLKAVNNITDILCKYIERLAGSVKG